MVPKSATDIGNGYFQTADDHMIDSGTCKTIATKDEKNGFFKNDDTFDPQAVSFFCANSGEAPTRPVLDCPCETEEQALALAYKMIEARVSGNPRIEYLSGVVKRTDIDGNTRWYPIQVNSGTTDTVQGPVGREVVYNMHFHPSGSRRASITDVVTANKYTIPGFIVVSENGGRLSKRILGYSPAGLIANFAFDGKFVKRESDWFVPSSLCSKEEKEAFVARLKGCGVRDGAIECQNRIAKMPGHDPYCNPAPGGILEGILSANDDPDLSADVDPNLPAGLSDPMSGSPSRPSGPKPGRTGAGNGSDDDSWWRKELDSWSEP